MTTTEQRAEWAAQHTPKYDKYNQRICAEGECLQSWPCPMAQLLDDLAAAQAALRKWDSMAVGVTWRDRILGCACDSFPMPDCGWDHKPDCATKAALEAVR